MIADLKPYPVMRNSGVSWLGAVPTHWRTHPVRRYCRVFAGATPSRSVAHYWENGSIPWLSSGDVNLRRIRTARQFITDAGLKNSSANWIRPGSLVVALAGQGKTKGMVATVEVSTTCNQSLAVIEPADSESLYEYLAYYLESRYQDIRALVGDGLRDGLNLEHVRSIPTPLPPLPEQAAIVRFLDHADRRIRRYIRAKQQLIALLEEQKQAIIHQAVRRGLDPNVRLKPSGVEWLGDVPEHWEVRRVKSLSLVKRGASPRPIADPNYFDGYGEYAWVRIADVTASSRYLERTTQRLSVLGQSLSVPLEPGALFLSIAGSVGKPIITRIKCCIHDGFVYFPQFTGDVEFLCRIFASGAPFARLGKLGTQLNLNTDTVGNISLGWPPSEEQAAIVSFLDRATADLDAATTSAQRETSLIREYHTHLIAAVVTGKFDVREAAARLPDEVEELEPLDEADALIDGEEEPTDALATAP